jgi:hypothetical protein
MGVLYDNADSERFTIAPVLDSLLPLPRLQELLEWLRSETGQVEPIVVDDERDGS